MQRSDQIRPTGPRPRVPWLVLLLGSALLPALAACERNKSIAEAFPDDVVERKIGIGEYLRSVRACKLHDFEAGRWLQYPTD